MTRSEILDTAKEYVNVDRAASHGDMENNFARIGDLWSAHLGITVSATDVALMMALLKIARAGSNPAHLDSWIDICGYGACGGELASKAQKP